MTETLFFRHLSDDDKGAALLDAVTTLRSGDASPDVHAVNPASFAQVPGSPFAYWISDGIRRLFVDLPPFEANGRVARRTNATTNDARWIRTWWEVQPEKVGRALGWVPHAKGGSFSPYYADLHLVISWDASRQTYPGYEGTAHRPDIRPASRDYFFRPGLTWPRRTNGLSFRVLPSESIFGDKGPGVFDSSNDWTKLLSICAIANSAPFRYLVELQLARVDLAQSFEAGIIQQTPIPMSIPESCASLAKEAFEVSRRLDTIHEESHVFRLPLVLQHCGDTLFDRLVASQAQTTEDVDRLVQLQSEINKLSFQAYGISIEDWGIFEAPPKESETRGDENETLDNDLYDERIPEAAVAFGESADRSLSYAVGCAFGRWDVRIAMDQTLAPELQGPFEPLPVCSPGMLVGMDGLPARPGGIVSEEWLRARPNAITLPDEGSVSEPTIPDSGYPLRLEWDGIMVDDEGHPDDIVARVRDVLTLIWHDRAGEIELEACEYLGVRELREYFSQPRRFWDAHVKRYSKSRRKAPIYWLLQSSKRNYAVWLYYHRMDADILYKALRNYVDPKIVRESNRLEELRLELPAALEAGGRAAKAAQKAVEDGEALLAEVEEFRKTLERVALLGLTVDHDDGVLLSIAPLHELTPWKPARQAWDELVAGKYEWSAMSKRMQEKGLVRERGSRR